MATSLLKFSLKTNLVKSIISEVVSNFSKYYYAYGKAYAWPSNDTSIADASDSYEYELSTRNDLLFLKQIDANDVAPVIRRINWISGYTFDMFDEYVSDLAVTGEVIVQNGSAVVTGIGTAFTRELIIGNTITIANVNYRVLAISSDTNLTLSTVYAGVTANGLTVTKKDSSYSGATNLETAEYYCVTDDFNVYKCLFNNNNKPSSVRPTGTSNEVITLADHYKWKYMYTIPLSLRNKFLTLSTMPVTTALNTQFYSAGSIVSASIENPGKSYQVGHTYLTITGDGVLEENPYVLSTATNGFVIDSPGSGYASVTLSFENPDLPNGIRAEATGIIGDLNAGVTASYSHITYNGSAATTILGSFSRRVAIGDCVKIGGTVYGVVARTLDSNGVYPISITVDATISPSASTVIYLTGCVTGIQIDNVGFGYSKPFYSYTQDPFASNLVAFTSTYITDRNGQGFSFSINSKKNEAEITPLISPAGEISSIIINKPGIGYTYAIVTVTDDYTDEDRPADFEKASILLNFAIGDIESAQSTVELSAIDGAIHAVRVIDPGYGYDSVPTVTIVGDGVGATAVAVLTADSRIDRIDIVTEGYGYTKAEVILTGVAPSQPAILSVPISPRGGHGSDAISELYCKSVVFHGILSKEKNKGFVSSNDYRQSCIIKNPKIYGKNSSLRAGTASTCIVVTGPNNQSNFADITNDMVMTYTENGKSYQFRVIEKNANYSATESALLLSYTDNKIPPAVATYGNATAGISFNGTGRILPDVNKLSGELLTIDNRQRFYASDKQIIVATNSLTF